MIQTAHNAYNAGDFKTAFELYSQLSDKNPDAQTSHGFMLQNGQGCEVDEAKALELYTKAAVREVPHAMYEVALMLERGIGCEMNNDTALDYCRKAAYKGHTKAKEIIKGLQEEEKIVF